MNVFYAAFNDYGDLIADDHDLGKLLDWLHTAGYWDGDYVIAKVHA